MKKAETNRFKDEGVTVNIHPTAIVDPKAKLGDNVTIGAYSVVGADVEVGNHSSIAEHVVVHGPTLIGEYNKIFPFASIGADCQDKKYAGEPTRLVIGDHNVIRESVTLNRGTVQDRGETTIGDNNLLMAYVHVGHDCVIANRTVLANNATLAGHVQVGEGAILGGFVGVHQYCQVGAYSMAAMCSAINKDVPAFVMVQGNMAKARGMNFEGMRRRGYDDSLVKTLRKAYKILYRQGLSLPSAIHLMESELPKSEELRLFVRSLQASKRGIIR